MTPFSTLAIILLSAALVVSAHKVTSAKSLSTALLPVGVSTSPVTFHRMNNSPIEVVEVSSTDSETVSVRGKEITNILIKRGSAPTTLSVKYYIDKAIVGSIPHLKVSMSDGITSLETSYLFNLLEYPCMEFATSHGSFLCFTSSAPVTIAGLPIPYTDNIFLGRIIDVKISLTTDSETLFSFYAHAILEK